MVSYVLNVDKVGDLKFGRKKCRLHKKSEVVQVAKDYGIPTPNKKTVSELCGTLKKKIQKEFFAPLGAAAFEVSWNNAPFAFDFDYGATFVGFLAYKFALSSVLYQIVREMMIGDSTSFYDTEEKVYNNLTIDE